MTWENIAAVLIIAATGAGSYFAGRWSGWQAGVLQAYLALSSNSPRYAAARELMTEANDGKPLGTLHH